MLRWLEATSTAVDVVLLHHVREASRTLFAAELERWSAKLPGFRSLVTATNEGGRHLDATRLDVECPDWRDREVFVCGPDAMAAFAMDHWGDAGLEERLHLERFVPAVGRGRSSAASGGPATGCATGTANVTFSSSNVVTTCDSATPLLDVAESAGLHPPSGCRMGICHTCTTHLDRGSVVDLRDGRIHEAGEHVQLCVSAALDDVSLAR
jgi:ferredoxin-NADP reductase